jgi:hypothetical protein
MYKIVNYTEKNSQCTILFHQIDVLRKILNIERNVKTILNEFIDSLVIHYALFQKLKK